MEYTEKELEQEVWRDVDGYEGIYQVSDLGRVRSHKSGEWRVLRPIKMKNCYLRVGLYRDGKQKNVLVHRLVAQAFVHNDDETKTQINHIDECKQNNRLSNLEYCTASYNVTYNGLQHRRMSNYHRSNYRRNSIKDLYDPNLSIKENLELFKSNGVECCEWTVKQLRKDLGLTKKTIK